MNNTPIRDGLALLVVVALAGCATDRIDQRQMADENCEYPNTMTCEQFAGELYNCICANEDDMRRMFDILSNK